MESKNTKTLVCILAQARAHEHTWESFRTNVLDELGAHLCVAIAKDECCTHDNPYIANAKYRFYSREWDDWALGFDFAARHVEDADDWRKALAVKGQWIGPLGGQMGSAGILIYFRWWLLHHLSILDYDRFVVTRSDFIWKCPHPPMELLDPARAWIPDGEWYGGYTDRHIVLSRQNVRQALNLIEPIMTRPTELSREMLAYSPDNWNLEKYVKFHLEKAAIPVSLFPYVMYTVRGPNGKTRWAHGGEIDPALGYAIKYKSEYESAIKFHKQIRNREDWRKFL